MRYVVSTALLVLGLAVAACGPSPAAPPASGPAVAPAGASAGSVSGVPAATPAPTPVALRYGYSATSIVLLPLKVAVDHGFYREQGLEVEQVLMGAGVMAAAQLAGEVDYTNSYPATIHSAAQGAPLFALMARPDIQSIADLRGKPVGITTRGGAVDKVTRALLADAGLDADTDVTILPSGGQVTVLLDALLSGRVQAAALSPPWFVRARDQGLRVLVRTPDVLHEPQNGLSVTVDRLTQQRDQVRRVVAAETAAARFVRQNREVPVALARDWLNISQAEAEESYDFALPAINPDARIDVAGLERYVANEKADGTLPADFQVTRILDTALAEEALRLLEQGR